MRSILHDMTVITITVLVAVFMAWAAFGAEVPEFPFKNFQQIGYSIPGLNIRSVGSSRCGDFIMSEFVYTDAKETSMWIIWASNDHLTAGVTDPAALLVGTQQGWIYFGTIHPQTRAITIKSVHTFQEKSRLQPCDGWGKPA